jgi:hypothetical protein
VGWWHSALPGIVAHSVGVASKTINADVSTKSIQQIKVGLMICNDFFYIFELK